MLLQLISRISSRPAQECAEQGGALRPMSCNTRASMYTLLREVQGEIARTERIFDLAEDEALIDNAIYQLKALTAQQQFLVQNLRRLEGIMT